MDVPVQSPEKFDKFWKVANLRDVPFRKSPKMPVCTTAN